MPSLKALIPDPGMAGSRSVGFLGDPVSAISRPVNTAESWACYDFEIHARKCAYCHNPYEVHRAHDQLCDVGHRLACDVAHYLSNKRDGHTYSQFEEDHQPVRVEIPASYDEVRGLLKAVERSLRHRSRPSFVTQNRTNYVAARVPAPQRSKLVIVEQHMPKDQPLPPSGEIVDWPATQGSVDDVRGSRGLLYHQDLLAESEKEGDGKQHERKVLTPISRKSRRKRKQWTKTLDFLDSGEEVEDDENDETSAASANVDIYTYSARAKTYMTASKEESSPLAISTSNKNNVHDGGVQGARSNSPGRYDPVARLEREGRFTNTNVPQNLGPVGEDGQVSVAVSRRSGISNVELREHNELITKVNKDDGSVHNEDSLAVMATENDDDKSSVGSFSGSVFSADSLASSATDLSKASGYSALQIATATQEVLSILLTDSVLRPLFTTAIQGDIGPQRFASNFRRLLKRYSDGLKAEAQDRLDYLAAKLVAIKARELAEAIPLRFQRDKAAPELAPIHTNLGGESKADSTDEEDEPNVNEDIFQHLEVPREFLVGSSAFTTLRSQFQQFVLSPKSFMNGKPRQDKSVHFQHPKNDSPENLNLTCRNTATGIDLSTTNMVSAGTDLEAMELHPKSVLHIQDDKNRQMKENDCQATENDQLSMMQTRVAYQQFTRFLTRHRQAGQIPKETIVETGSKSFVDSYCKILKTYYNDLQIEAQINNEQAIVRTLQGLDQRTIARKILHHIHTDVADDQNDTVEHPISHQGKSATFLETWLENQQEQSPADSKDSNTPSLPQSDREIANHEDERISVEEAEILNFRHMEQFLQRGPAFRNLKRNIRLLSLRTSLREIVDSVPGRCIRISSDNCTTLINQFKGWLEDYTVVEWDWWPLTPRILELQTGQRRLEWKLCGQILNQNLSPEEASIIEEVLQNGDNHPPRCYCCEADMQQSSQSTIVDRLIMSMSRFLRQRVSGSASSGSSQSTASQRYTPTSPTSTNSSTPNALGNSQVRSSPASGVSGNAPPQVQGQQTGTPFNATTTSSSCVLFGVQGSRWSLELEQIKVATLINDAVFFRELKARYKRHRGWVKLLLSPFRFRFCKFVKFEKFDVDRVLSQGEDLPDYHGFEHDYDYAPRPGKNPLINPKTFAVYLNACDPSCLWPLVNPWHDCVALPCRYDKLRCIPKKKSEFDVSSDDVEIVAWGLEADYALSFAFLAVYHLVPILGAIGFWIYWLVQHPGDWQNSAVPILTVLALFAAFWIPFGKQLGMV